MVGTIAVDLHIVLRKCTALTFKTLLVNIIVTISESE